MDGSIASSHSKMCRFVTYRGEGSVRQIEYFVEEVQCSKICSDSYSKSLILEDFYSFFSLSFRLRCQMYLSEQPVRHP